MTRRDVGHEFRRLAFEPSVGFVGEKLYPGRVFIKARDHGELFAARVHELLFAFFGNLFERFEAIRNEGRGHDDDSFFTLFGEAFQCFVCVRLEPRFAAQSRLERNGEFVLGDAGTLGEVFCRGKALMAVTSAVDRAASATAVRHDVAVSFGGVRFIEVADRNAVIGE